MQNCLATYLPPRTIATGGKQIAPVMREELHEQKRRFK
jgi:hypothetical protein